MFSKFFKIAFLSALLSSFSFADDFLAKLTNGALSDNLAGVKKLTLDEASQVVGGYYVIDGPINANEYAVIAVPNAKTTRYQRVQINNVTLGDEDQLLTYIVKKNIGYSRNGRFLYFSYNTAVYYKPTRTFIRLNSSQVLNHNGVIQELTRAYKSTAERYLQYGIR